MKLQTQQMTNDIPNTQIVETSIDNGRFLRMTTTLNRSTGKWNVMVEDFLMENETGNFVPNDVKIFQVG
jgi:hypothetical protein